MSYLFFFLFYMVGVLVGAVGIIQIMLCLRCVPCYSNELVRKEIITAESGRNIKKASHKTILLWSVIVIAATALILIFTSQLSWAAYGMGIVTTLLAGMSKTSPKNPDNYQDYVKSYAGFIRPGAAIPYADSQDEETIAR